MVCATDWPTWDLILLVPHSNLLHIDVRAQQASLLLQDPASGDM